MNPIIRESKASDITALSGSLREADSLEAVAQGYTSPKEALRRSFGGSIQRYTVEVNGMPVAMLGLVETNTRAANVWLLGGNGLSDIKKSFVKLSRVMIKGFLSQYPILWAQVDARYTKTRRWLEWLGAEMGETYSLNGVEFNNFVFRRP